MHHQAQVQRYRNVILCSQTLRYTVAIEAQSLHYTVYISSNSFTKNVKSIEIDFTALLLMCSLLSYLADVH